MNNLAEGNYGAAAFDIGLTGLSGVSFADDLRWIGRTPGTAVVPGVGFVDDVGGSNRLVVGGGRGAEFPSLAHGDVSLNVNPVAKPHVVGNIRQAPFENASFDQVFFERVPFSEFTGRNSKALSESSRVLKPGGTVTILTGSAVDVPGLVGDLRRSGFSDVQQVLRNDGPVEILATKGGR